MLDPGLAVLLGFERGAQCSDSLLDAIQRVSLLATVWPVGRDTCGHPDLNGPPPSSDPIDR